MTQHPFSAAPVAMLICTVRNCRLALHRDGQRMVCANNHSFDVARSGYINLLQPQDRKSKNPGDPAEAVAARRRSFRFAQPLVDAVVRAFPLASGQSLLDVGCGEGQYLEAFRRAYGCACFGTDISIPAIDLAAKTHPHCTWIVANADRFIPFADASLHAVMSVTARLNPEEFRRILANDGTLLVVLPAADDLIELREAVQGEGLERDRVERTIRDFTPRFTLAGRDTTRNVARLERSDMEDVMSSSYRGLRHRERQRLATLDAMEVTMARDLLWFRPG